MRFFEPHILYFLFLAPLLYLFFLIAHWKRKSTLGKIGLISTLSQFTEGRIVGVLRQEGLFASLAMLFFIISLARPQAGTKLEPVRITGSDIYIAIDLSKSMGAEDIKPSRIERAKIDALELVHSLRGDRVGLILFAGEAFVQSPLTNDYDAVTTFISSLDFSTAISSGTDLSTPIEATLKFLKPEEEKYTLLLLLTDGEDTVGNYEKAVKDASKRGIKIMSAGIGTKEGSPIPVYDKNEKRVGYLKDDTGKVVISKLQEDLLKEISEGTRGAYFPASGRLNEIGKILSTIDNMKKRELEVRRYTVYEERFQFPLTLGIIFVFLYIFVSRTGKVSL